MTGAILGHYQIVRALGSGGMGEVFLAEDTRLKRRVAIKMLPSALASDADRRERFEREAQTIAALNHPNIVTVHSIDHAGDAHFITMEYVDGRTLSDSIPKHGLPLARLLTIATQIVDAVATAHDRGIVHRDLKPANVMLTGADRVKVLDFGLAKLRDAPPDTAATLPTRELTGEGRIVGTVAYMSPEQAEGKPVDGRSDIFSIGVMLYECAAGERPFKGETSLSVMTGILRDTPPALGDVNPELPREFTRIVQRCLAKDPERRYQSGKDLRNDLEELQQQLTSGELNAVVRQLQPSRRRWVGPAVVALAAVGLVAIVWPRGRGGDSTNIPELTYARLTVDGVERFPSVSPDGKWVVYVSNAAGNDDIYLQSTTGQTAINLTKGSNGVDTMPAFSPDGELIAFRSDRDGSAGIYVMGRTGDGVRRVTDGGFFPAWFPDGKRIAFSTAGPVGPENRTAFSQVMLCDVSACEPRPLYDDDAVQPAVSPHGTRIAYWSIPWRREERISRPGSAGANRDVWTIGVDGRQPVLVAPHAANDWNPVWSPDGRWLYFLSNRSGSMNLWRIGIDEATGATRGDPQPVTTPAPYVAWFGLAASGSTAVYTSVQDLANISSVPFDARSGTVAGPPEEVTSGTHNFFYFDVSPDGRSLVAATSSRVQEDLFIIDVLTRSIRQLTNDFWRDRIPRWAPDGRQIYLYSDRAGPTNVWTINADGSGLRQLSFEPFLGYPVPSPDGKRVAATDQTTQRIFIYDAADWSKPLETLPSVPERAADFPSATYWCEDGPFLFGQNGRGGHPWRYSLETHEYRIFARPGGGRPVSVDRNRFIYLSDQRLWLGDIESGTARELLHIPRETVNEPHLSKDRSRLFFIRQSLSSNIWLARFKKPLRSD